MKEYKKLQPEVIVGLGDNTIFLEKEPPFRTVVDLHIELEDWLGDDLMECHPCYIVTEQLKTALENSKYTGFEFADMTVTKSDYFNDNYLLNKRLPKFYRIKITGRENVDDTFIGDRLMLFACGDLIDLLKRKFSVNYLDIDTGRNEFDELLDKMISERKMDSDMEQDEEQQSLLKKLLDRAIQRNGDSSQK